MESIGLILGNANKVGSRVPRHDFSKTAVKAVEQGRQATEDMISDGKRMMRRKPVESAGVIFAAGMLTGAIFTWIVSRRD